MKLETVSKEFQISYGFGVPFDLPDYEPSRLGDWAIKARPGGVSSSYLSELVVEPPYFLLSKGDEVWMSTGLIEVESHAWHLHKARGNILVAGLGMGMFAYAAAAKPDVSRVVVIERDPAVIALMKLSTQFEEWSHRNKVVILQGDALDQSMAHQVLEAFEGLPPDYLYADIWPVFPAPEAPQQTRDMIALYSPAEAGWWGQEIEYGVWLEEQNGIPDLPMLEKFFKEYDVRVSVTKGYSDFCADAFRLHFDNDRYNEAAPGI